MKELNNLKALLDTEYEWPGPYLFKFIVPAVQLLALKGLLSGHDLIEKPSKNGKYISITLTITCESSQKVIDLYEKVSSIPGIMSL
ncbi:DUF493 domain-containing protein [Halobacteriovorax marinus]|uniref:DUF493 domain-containing protein n=1 Tax=Halobacteriovorax marinus TaxID=97084 RepID=A0A1Y5FD52_9BACT|nr:DUF493 domain-containing protein [Halobacteriovorax marinus]